MNKSLADDGSRDRSGVGPRGERPSKAYRRILGKWRYLNEKLADIELAVNSPYYSVQLVALPAEVLNVCIPKGIEAPTISLRAIAHMISGIDYLTKQETEGLLWKAIEVAKSTIENPHLTPEIFEAGLRYQLLGCAEEVPDEEEPDDEPPF